MLRRASFVEVPFDRDEGVYAFVAQQWRQALLPYRDVFDHKPPLVYIAYRLCFALGGEHLVAVRVGFALLGAATAWLCALVVWLVYAAANGLLGPSFDAVVR